MSEQTPQDWRNSHDWREAAARLAATDEYQQRELGRHDRLLDSMAPLSSKIDVLTQRVDVLTQRVDVLTQRVDVLMTDRIEALTTRVASLEQSVKQFLDDLDQQNSLQLKTWQLLLATGTLFIAAGGGVVAILRALGGH